MDNGVWFVDWGCLPLMDRKLLAMDGCHKLPSWEWGKTAEVEREGILNITKAAKATIPAHTRQIKIYNAVDRETSGYPTKQLSEFLYSIQAYPSIADPTIIARRDLAIFVNSRDVTAEQINQTHTTRPDAEYSLLSEVLKWCWSDKTDVIFTEEALTYLLHKATELYETFHYAAIPVVSADMKFKLARLSTALAYLTLSVSENYQTVTVTKEHVEVVVNFLTEEYSKAGLNILAQTNKHERLTIEDVEAFFTEIETNLYKDPVERSVLCKILKTIVFDGRITADIMRTTFSLAENNQRRPLSATLQSLGLTKFGKGGVYPTPKLIEACKVSEGFSKILSFNGVNRVNGAKNDTPYNKLTEKQGLMGYCNAEVTQVNAEVNSTEKTTNPNIYSTKPKKTEVTEQTEVKTEMEAQEDSVGSYEPNKCFICKERLMENDWDEFSEGKAHKVCYDEKRLQLKQPFEMPDFEDKCNPPEDET
jgi:hypothetical protein